MTAQYPTARCGRTDAHRAHVFPRANGRPAFCAGTGPDVIAGRPAPAPGRSTVRLCGDCWAVILPDEYAPDASVYGDCEACGYPALTYRAHLSDLSADRDAPGFDYAANP